MKIILWLDDDLPDFPYVPRALRDLGCEVKLMYSVCMAFEYLSTATKANQCDCLLLDAIVPVGKADVDDSVYEQMIELAGRPCTDYRYAGFLLLDAFGKDRIAEKTVILSLVTKERLAPELGSTESQTPQLNMNVPIVEKLGLDLDNLTRKVRAVLESNGGS